MILTATVCWCIGWKLNKETLYDAGRLPPFVKSTSSLDEVTVVTYNIKNGSNKVKIMRKRVLWITETAVMLALLICLQWVGSFVPDQMTKQLITGSMVNCVLVVTVLVAGMSSGITVAVISPVCAFLFGIAPNFITVVPIMLGNACYVVLLRLIIGKQNCSAWKQDVALVVAATAKFALLYLLVVKLICGAASGALLGKKLGDIVVLAPPMLKMLPTMFAWPQLVTALVGGCIGLLIASILKKSLRRN